MLQSMRKGLFSKFFMLLLVMGGVGLAVMDWQGAYTGGNVGTNDVAKIGKDRISMPEFYRQVQQNLQGANISEYDAYHGGIIHQLLSRQIQGRMMNMAAEDAGLRIGKEQLAEQLKVLLQPLRSEGLSARDAMKRLAQASGQSQKQLIADVGRREAARLLLEPLGVATAIPSTTMAAELARINGEQRKLSVLKLPQSRLNGIKAPSEEQLAKHYESTKNRYTKPEKRALELVILDSDKLSAEISVGDDDIAAYYAENKDTYAITQRRTVEQILVKDKADLAKVKTDAGQSLESAAKAAGLEKAYQKPAEYGESDLPEELATPIFAAKEGDLINNVQSPLGWHLIKVTKADSASHKPLAEVRDEIVTKLKQDSVAQQLEDLANQLDDALASGAKLDEATKGLPVQIVKLGTHAAKGGNAESFPAELSDADRAAVMKLGFELDEGETAPLFALSDDRYATVYVNSITPAVTPPLTDVAKDVAADWTATTQKTNNMKEAGSYLEQLKAGKLTLADIAKETGMSIKTITVKADTAPPAPLKADIADQVFKAQAGEHEILVDVDAAILVHVDSITYPAATALAKDAIDAAQTSEMQAFQEGVLGAMMEDMQASGRVMLNQALLERSFNRQPTTEDAAQ